jgi:hypothetical protein
MSLAAAIALAVRIADPFAHGAWLVAYLVLVGFGAQLLLGVGQAALLSAGGWTLPPRRVRLAQALLWNFGVVAVPAGVLAQTRLAVVVGSLSLIAALASLARTARPGLAPALADAEHLPNTPRWNPAKARPALASGLARVQDFPALPLPRFAGI